MSKFADGMKEVIKKHTISALEVFEKCLRTVQKVHKFKKTNYKIEDTFRKCQEMSLTNT